MELLRCKVCGYIIKSNKLGDVCPACGVPKTAFEPYKETMSQKRKAILDLDLHPIMVHFPQAFAAVIPPFILLSLLSPISAGTELLITVKVLAILLPLAVIPAALCGIIDGKTRFKKITTPLLKKKIIGASVLFVMSLALAAVTATFGIESAGKWYVFIIAIGCIACEIVLAQIGKTLMNAKMPG
jgi:rubredoxin